MPILQIRALPTPKIIPGHGPVANKDALLKRALYLEDLRKEVASAIAKGLSLEEAQESVTIEKFTLAVVY